MSEHSKVLSWLPGVPNLDLYAASLPSTKYLNLIQPNPYNFDQNVQAQQGFDLATGCASENLNLIMI